MSVSGLTLGIQFHTKLNDFSDKTIYRMLLGYWRESLDEELLGGTLIYKGSKLEEEDLSSFSISGFVHFSMYFCIFMFVSPPRMF